MHAQYEHIRKMIEYWLEPDPSLRPGPGYDEWRRRDYMDCIIAGEDPDVGEDMVLNADMIFSLWIPLRATLNRAECQRWVYWREFEYGVKKPEKNPRYERGMISGGVEKGREYASQPDTRGFRINRHPAFLEDMKDHIEEYLPVGDEATEVLEELFRLGQTRANVMILFDRRWNAVRGGYPFFDYVPHFLAGLLGGDARFGGYQEKEVSRWIEEQKLNVFFDGERVSKEGIVDLIGTGSLERHSLGKITEALPSYLTACCEILERRGVLIG